MVRPVRWMNTQIGFGHIEDKPALTDVVVNKTEFVPDEHTHFLGMRRTEQSVYSSYHLTAASRMTFDMIGV
jgi:hypothetical protein